MEKKKKERNADPTIVTPNLHTHPSSWKMKEEKHKCFRGLSLVLETH